MKLKICTIIIIFELIFISYKLYSNCYKLYSNYQVQVEAKAAAEAAATKSSQDLKKVLTAIKQNSGIEGLEIIFE